MELMIKTHNLRLDQSTREYIESHTSKLDRVNERITEAKFEIRDEPTHRDGERYAAQFTIATKRAILRAEERSADMRVAIDGVIDKMNRQIRRFHERRIRRNRRDAVNLGVLAADQSSELAEAIPDDDEPLNVVRTKRFKIQPMDTSEAIEQIELLGHDFFVFFNADTNQMNVLYRRKDEQYGLIVPEIA
jgi:putative sigma-54 modulation protein